MKIHPENELNFVFYIFSKDIDINTHYNHFHTSNLEKKQAVLTEKPSYQKLDKSVVNFYKKYHCLTNIII